MAGFRVAALGLVVVAIIQLAPAALKGVWTVAAAALAFILIAVMNINTAYVILMFIVLGLVVTAAGGQKSAEASASRLKKEEVRISGDEEGGDGE
jgi:chromate transporter